MQRKAIASGIIYGRDDNLMRPIEHCTVTELGRVVVKLKGVEDEIHAFDLADVNLRPDDFKGLSVAQARELRDEHLAS